MDKTFIDGMNVRKPLPQAPKWIIANVSLNTARLSEFMKKNEVDGWISVNIKESKKGEYYAELNNWKQKAVPAENIPTIEPEQTNDIPF